MIFAILFFWGVAFWLFSYRNAPDPLSERIPLLYSYRKQRLQPLFKNREDVLRFALWPFLLGDLFFVLLIVNLMKN